MADFVAGPYTATYGGLDLGLTTQGFTVSHEFFKRMITGDQFGDGPVNAVYRGRAQFVEFESLEAEKAGVYALAEPYGSTATSLNSGVIGQFDVAAGDGTGTCAGVSSSLVLTKVATSCATPVTLTFPLAILAEGYPVRALYGQDLRTIPLRMRVYPSSSGVFGTRT